METMKKIPSQASKEEGVTTIPKGSRGKRLEARGIFTDFDFVNSQLQYDPETGLIVWRCASGNGHRKAGDKAGYVCKTWGYVMIGFGGKNYRAHRLAWLLMTGKWPNEEIDHINRVKSDNRWENLRLASHLENMWNLPVMRHNTSGIRGVHWNQERNVWQAYIFVNEKHIYLGAFDSKNEAAKARRFAELTYHEGRLKDDEIVCSAQKCAAVERRA